MARQKAVKLSLLHEPTCAAAKSVTKLPLATVKRVGEDQNVPAFIGSKLELGTT